MSQKQKRLEPELNKAQTEPSSNLTFQQNKSRQNLKRIIVQRKLLL